MIFTQELMQLTKMNLPIDCDLSLFEAMPFHIYAKDTKGKYLEMNEAMARDIGIKKPVDFIGCEDFDMPYLPYDEAKKLRSNDERVLQLAQPEKFIQPVTIVNGIKVNLLSYKAPLNTRAKKRIGVIGISLIQNMREQAQPLLTERQTECLFLLVKGMTIKEIAKSLLLSPRTVEHYVSTIKLKLHCKTRSNLVTKALKMEIIQNRL